MQESAAKQQQIEYDEVSDMDETMPLPTLSHLLEADEAPIPAANPDDERTHEYLSQLIELSAAMNQRLDKIADLLAQQQPKTRTGPTRKSAAAARKSATGTRKAATGKTSSRSKSARKTAAADATGAQGAT